MIEYCLVFFAGAVSSLIFRRFRVRTRVKEKTRKRLGQLGEPLCFLRSELPKTLVEGAVVRQQPWDATSKALCEDDRQARLYEHWEKRKRRFLGV